MSKKLWALMFVPVVAVTWAGVSAAQQSAAGQVLRVFTATMQPDKARVDDIPAGGTVRRGSPHSTME